MKTYIIATKKYYLYSDLKNAHPNIFNVCTNSRSFVIKNKLANKNFTFARLTNKKWIVVDGSGKRFDKIFILASWFDKTYPNNEFDPEGELEGESAEEPKEENDIEHIHAIIDLEDDEKFVDNDGNIIEIEVRGKREYDKCYFKVKDIMNGFNLNRLSDMIMHKNSGYDLDTHYKFYYETVNYGRASKKEKKNKKEKNLFLTYTGLLRVLFASHKNTADKFINWASKILFTAQMGTSDQRNELVGNLLGVSAQSVKEVFSKTTNTIPSIYLFSLGSVKDLRKSFKIDTKYKDTDYVYKWGMTDSLARRTNQHKKTFSKISKIRLELIVFGLIDPQYISEAEVRIKHLFFGMDLTLKHDTFTELAIIPEKKMKVIKEHYDTISKAYMGHIKELVEQVKSKDNEMAFLKETHAKELALKNYEMLRETHAKELALINNQLLRKDLELANIKFANTKADKKTK